MMFEKGFLRKIFGPTKDETIGNWRKLHDEELHNIHSLLRIIRMITSRRMDNAYSTNWEERRAYRLSVLKPEGKKQLVK